MRNVILMTLLIAVSGTAVADQLDFEKEWGSEPLAQSDEWDTYTKYASAAERRQNLSAGIFTKLEVDDYKKPQLLTSGVTFLSSKKEVQYDCKQRKSRIISEEFYSGNKLKNSIGRSSRSINDEWVDDYSPVFEFFCRRG